MPEQSILARLPNLSELSLPKDIDIVEVGPRDGLQNEAPVSTAFKVKLIDQLSKLDYPIIEVGAFVSPKWIPQMADTAEVFQQLTKNPITRYSALTPNIYGLEQAIAAGADEVAVFIAASETFSQKNTNCSIEQSLIRVRQIINEAERNKIKVRGYLSCVMGCPFEQYVLPEKVIKLTDELLAFGCYQISLGDTIGIGTPKQTQSLLDQMIKIVNPNYLAAHFHDTHNRALANVDVALDMGIKTIDTAIGGLGGCPYAPGAKGNLATESLLSWLNNRPNSNRIHIGD